MGNLKQVPSIPYNTKYDSKYIANSVSFHAQQHQNTLLRLLTVCVCPSLSFWLMSFSLNHCWIKAKANEFQKPQPRVFGNKNTIYSIKWNI